LRWILCGGAAFDDVATGVGVGIGVTFLVRFVLCLDGAEPGQPGSTKALTEDIVINDTSHPKLQADSSLQAITGLHPSRKTQHTSTGTE